MAKKRKVWRWRDLSLVTKVLIQVATVALLLFIINIFMYWQVNQAMQSLDQVYASNVNLTELSETLEAVQADMYSYLSVKTSDSLENYYRSEGNYRSLLEQLNEQVMENPVKLLERNIRKMSETYLDYTAETIQAKRGRNVEKYKNSYADTLRIYSYLNSYIDKLNNQQFKNNSSSYLTMQNAIRYLEIVSTTAFVVLMGLCILMLFFMVRDVIAPLTNLASTANLVGQANFNVKMPHSDAEDEMGIVTRAFNTMVSSLEEYMTLTKENMEKEQQMIERELLMEAHLKEAQLKYLQSQINPHFLFNSLNAGAQLAMMEDAEKTCVFVERMADFFRYNVKKGNEDATLREEVDAVENYIYILNVRYAGDIHFTKEIDESVLECKMPSMILQPIVENALMHGIHNIEWQGEINLKVEYRDGLIFICVKDNGKGITQEKINQILNGEIKSGESQGDSTGVGLNNVISRLELYYKKEKLVEIKSPGENQGTEVIVKIPYVHE